MSHSIAPVSQGSGIICRRPLVISLSAMDAESLLKLCIRRDANAWYEFVRRVHPVITSVVVKILRRCMSPTSSLVDDLVQETYLKLCANNFKALREFNCRHEHALTGFLRVVASNVTQDYLRSSLSQKRGCGKGEDELDSALPRAECATSSVASIEQSIAVDEIERCLESRCSEATFKRDSTIFWLYYRHGLTADAIALRPEIGLSVKGVESALFRLTRFLRLQLNGRQSAPRPAKLSTASVPK